jgi:hypothetical protein
VYGIPIINPMNKIKIAARAAIIDWPPTNEPTLVTIALTNFEILSLLVAGTNCNPIFITCGSEARK